MSHKDPGLGQVCLLFRCVCVGECACASDLEVLMSRQLIGQVDSLMRSPLRHHDDTANLLHLGVVRGTGAIEVACNLDTHKH